MFDFKFYSNQLPQATRSMAAGTFFVGLLIIGFGLLVFWLKELFAFLALFIFGVIGLSVIGFSIKLFIASWMMNRPRKGPEDQYRENVRIHHGDIDSDEW